MKLINGHITFYRETKLTFIDRRRKPLLTHSELDTIYNKPMHKYYTVHGEGDIFSQRRATKELLEFVENQKAVENPPVLNKHEMTR